MSMSGEASGISESSTPNPSQILESSSISNNTAETKKLENNPSNKVISLINSDNALKEETDESHLNRLQNLRNELSYINDTDWMYESLEKKQQ